MDTGKTRGTHVTKSNMAAVKYRVMFASLGAVCSVWWQKKTTPELTVNSQIRKKTFFFSLRHSLSRRPPAVQEA